MGALLLKIRNSVNANSLIKEGQSVAVALSGGPDSVALLYLLNELKKSVPFTLSVAHFDHKYRPESGKEADFVKSIADSLSIKFHLGENREGKPPTGAQEVARKLRYAFFKTLVDENFVDRVATAHTLDDSVETSLMWALRGAGPRAFAGIPAKRGHIIRPLLNVEKKELLDWLSEKSIKFINDPSNESSEYLRNRIRQNILPAMEEESGTAKQKFYALTTLVSAQSGLVTKVSSDEMEKMSLAGSLDLNKLAGAHLAIRYEIYRLAAKKAGLPTNKVTLERIEAIDKVILAKKLGRKVELADGYVAILDHAGFSVLKDADQETGKYVKFDSPLSRFFSGAGEVTVETGSDRPGVKIDLSKIPGEALFRTRESGDRIKRDGVGHCSLKKFFIDKKIPVRNRNTLPLLAVNEMILWIPDLFISREIIADEKSSKVASLSFISSI